MQADRLLMTDLTLELRFTDIYAQNDSLHPAVREAQCLAAQSPLIFAPIQAGDLFVGRVQPRLAGFHPDYAGNLSGYYCDVTALQAILHQDDIASERYDAIQWMLDFWEAEATYEKIRQNLPQHLRTWLPDSNADSSPGVIVPRYHLNTVSLDYDYLLSQGIDHLTMAIDARRMEARTDGTDVILLDAMLSLMQTVVRSALHLAEMAHLQSRETDERNRKRELLQMAYTLINITEAQPVNLREALQMVLLYSALAGSPRLYGRMDVYLGDFLARDLAAGHLNERQASRLLASCWRLIRDAGGEIVIGGAGRRNPTEADVFCAMALDLIETQPDVVPSVVVRLDAGMPPALHEKAQKLAEAGRLTVYDDSVAIPDVQHKLDIESSMATGYVPMGGGTFTLNGAGFAAAFAGIDLIKVLDEVMRGELSGSDVEQRQSLETAADFEAAFKNQLEAATRAAIDFEVSLIETVNQDAALLFETILTRDCIARGRGILEGGANHLSAGVTIHGITQVGSRLHAIKTMVYEKGETTLDALAAALIADFVGHDTLRAPFIEAAASADDAEVQRDLLAFLQGTVSSYRPVDWLNAVQIRIEPI